MRILVFEGFTRRREMLNKLISDCVKGVQLYECCNLEEVNRVLSKSQIDIFVVDLHIEKGSGEIPGLVLIDWLRKTEEYYSAYIIVISELIDKQLVIYKDYHCYKFYENPINKDEFKNDITELALRRELDLVHEKIKNKDYMFVTIDDIFYKVYYANIIMIETHSKYDIIYVRDIGELSLPKHILRQFIKNLESTEMLYCNRSEIVNMRNVVQIDRKNRMITLAECDRQVYVTDIGKKNLKKYLEYWKAKS